MEVFFWKRTKISNFGGISKFLELIVFGQFWVDFVVLAMADNMPKRHMKS
jgi:hypothetical protein